MQFNVFYLEDEADLRDIFTDSFSTVHIEVRTCGDPLIAIEEIKSNPPDLIFVDYRLPKMRGDEFAKLVDPKIPKALITGELNVQCVVTFDAIFDKPFKYELIQTFIARLAKQRSAA